MGALSKFGSFFILAVLLLALGLGGAIAQGEGGEEDGGDTRFAVSCVTQRGIG